MTIEHSPETHAALRQIDDIRRAVDGDLWTDQPEPTINTARDMHTIASELFDLHAHVAAERNRQLVILKRTWSNARLAAAVGMERVYLIRVIGDTTKRIASTGVHVRRTNRPTRKLDATKAAAIRASTATTAQLAAEYNVAPTTIRSIRRGETWAS